MIKHLSISLLCSIDNMLSDRDILKVLKEHPKFIVPFNKNKLNPSGYDISLSDKWLFYVAKRSIALDPYDNSINEEIEEVKKDKFLLSRGCAVLAKSIEKFDIPKDIVGFLIGRSSLTRLGIQIGTTILEPEWRGYITIPISNVGNRPIFIYANRPFAQVYFKRLSSIPIRRYKGKYQNAIDIEGSKLYLENTKGAKHYGKS